MNSSAIIRFHSCLLPFGIGRREGKAAPNDPPSDAQQLLVPPGAGKTLALWGREHDQQDRWPFQVPSPYRTVRALTSKTDLIPVTPTFSLSFPRQLQVTSSLTTATLRMDTSRSMARAPAK